MESDNEIRDFLLNARTLAVVGSSPEESRDSHQISRTLQHKGYRIIPVNPNYRQILGETTYPDVASIPADIHLDGVVIFRDPQYTAEMVRSVIQRVEQTGQKPVIWTQLGVTSSEARDLARNSGLAYVEHQCIAVAYARLNIGGQKAPAGG